MKKRATAPKQAKSNSEPARLRPSDTNSPQSIPASPSQPPPPPPPPPSKKQALAGVKAVREDSIISSDSVITEEIPKLKRVSKESSRPVDAGKIAIGKRKKVSESTVKALMEKASLNTKVLAEDYTETEHLSAIKGFDKKNLKSRFEDSDDLDDFDSAEIKDSDRKPKTLDLKVLYQNHLQDDELDYPVERFQYVILQIEARAKTTLNFAGIPSLTDLVFAIAYDFREREWARFKSVQSIILDGCNLITDAGLKWMAQAFPKLTMLSLVGCIRVTDAGIFSLADFCPDLISIDLSGTNVNFLPRKWIDAEGMRMTCAPILYPLVPADAKDKKAKQATLKPDAKDVFNISILQLGAMEVSVLAALKGEKQPASQSDLPSVRHVDSFAVNSDLIASVSEANQSMSTLLVSNRSVVVIPSTLNDKTKIHDEAASIVATIINITATHSDVKFVIVGCSSENRPIVPTDFVHEEVISYAKKVAAVLRERHPMLSSDPKKKSSNVEKMKVDKQMKVGQAVNLLLILENLATSVSALEINVDKNDKRLAEAVSKSAKSLACLKNVTYDKDTWDWASTFDKKCPKGLATGIHTLNQAADIMAANFNVKERLRSFGAIHFLAHVGQLCMWQDLDKVTLVANRSWLLKVFNTLQLSDTKGVKNNGQNHILADDCNVFLMELLREEAKKQGLEMKEVEQVAEAFPNLFVVGMTTVTSWTKLSESSVMPTDIFTAYDKGTSKYDCLHIMYNFVMDQNLTPSLLHKILGIACKLHVPIHVWQNGVIINETVVAVMIGQTGYSKLLNLCVYITNQENDKKNTLSLIWNTIEKYRVMILHCLFTAGIDVEEICRASNILYTRPKNTSGTVSGHTFNSQNQGLCGTCGVTAIEGSLLADFKLTTSPSFLGVHATNKTNLQGLRRGSLIEITGPCTTGVRCNLSPLECRWCGVSLIQGNVRLLVITFKSMIGSSSISLDLHKSKVSWNFDDKEGEVDITKKLQQGTLQGTVVWFHLTYQNAVCIMNIYMGPCLLHSLEVPYSNYNLVINAENFQKTGNQAVVTAHSTRFQGRSSSLAVNMRLEALDRLTPNLICVATILEIQGDKVLIHFDGWTDRYDYWTNFNHQDLHPIGYMADRNGRPSNGKRVNRTLQPPNGYKKAFTWATYLQEMDAEPVPYDCFGEHQLEGCPSDETDQVLDHLGLIAYDPTDIRCKRSLQRSSYYYTSLKHILSTASASHDVRQAIAEDKEKGIFPYCHLPSDMTLESLRYPIINDILPKKKTNIHLFCEGQGLDFHLVNHKGIPMGKNLPETTVETLIKWSDFNAMVFYTILATQKELMSSGITEIIQGTKGLGKEKVVQLEKGFHRLLRIYLLSIIIDFTLNNLSEEEQKTMKTKFGQTLSTLFKDTMNADPDFAKLFAFTQDSYICQAHKLADSPNHGITEINIDSFQGLTSRVYTFNMNSNPLTAIPSDFFTHFHNITQLFLERCNLTELPPFSPNVYLEEIYVKGNKLTSLPADMKELKDLKILHISNNPLGSLPSVVSSLTSLTKLAADNIGNVDLNLVVPLVNLTYLSMSFNLIEDVPEKFGSLPLQTLYMAGLPFMSTRETFSATGVVKMMEDIVVYQRISKEDQTEMIQKVENSGETSNAAKVGIFNNLLMEKYPRIGKMKKQTDGVIPPAFFKLKGLQKLHLSNQAFTSVPEAMQELKQVTGLNFDANPRLENVSAELAKLSLKELHLRDCPSLKTPPKEVVRRGFLAVFGYLKRLLQGSVVCKRTKLMMVGLGGAGKTSLVRALTNKNTKFYEDYGEKITDGIDITEWLVDTKKYPNVVDINSEEPLRFSVWDFAGQTVYYNTHQFFLSNRAVYLLLWNIRLGFEHAGLDFWLSSIACHAPKAPILVVGTHCDKVKKGKLPTEELKRRFPQIYGFHFVSSYSGEGIDHLTFTLIKSALEQKYMGEKIPEAWLSLETGLDTLRKEKESLVPWPKIEEIANTAGIFDSVELVQAVQFLHDLGSVQFFNTSFLKSLVVIVPQWIVDVMACIVTVHEGPIKEGKLLYSDMVKVWKDYPQDLHPWLLRLTEEFDLTFPIANEEANIVPCLLPNSEPNYEFASLKKDSQEREALMIYRFEYLPAGLFNRAQVRLHQFSDSAVMWKKGFMLKKNNHRALLLQTTNTEVNVTARGFKPENILFLVHEVFECLIADCYSGVSYDFSIPCLECAVDEALEPSMFSASKIKRAFEMKAPFLQCDRNFHIISIPEIQAVMPPDSNSDFDDHLGRNVRELQDLEEGVAIKVLFIYSKKNIPDLTNEGKVVDPTQILTDLRAAGFNVSYCDDPETANMESMTLAIKAAQIVIIGISDEFILDEQCKNLIIYTKQTLNKTIILATLGSTLSWMKTDINIVLADEVFVKMTEASRYTFKIKELVEAVKTRISKKKDVYPECFISYCWVNSQNAVDLGTAKKEGAVGWADPRKIKDFLQEKGINCWLDINQMGQEGFFEDIADGLRKAKVMVSCVSDEYAASKNCKMEFRFAISTLKIPTVLAVVGTGYNWERSEIGLLTVGHSQNCPKINLQYENDAGMLELLKEVQTLVQKSGSDNGSTRTTEQQQNVAFQEVLELTQRKLLRHIMMYSENMDNEPYPRLFIVDIKDKTKDVKQKRPKTASLLMKEDQRKDEEGDGEKRAASPGKKSQEEIVEDVSVIGDELEDEREKSNAYCFRLLCEHEQGWHESPEVITFPAKDGEALDNFLREVSPYLVRIMAILKYTKLNLPILNTPKGERLQRNMEEWCTRTNSDFQGEYSTMLEHLLDEDINRTYGGLKKCNMPNGKTLWLCPKHEKFSYTQTEEKYKDQIHKGVGQEEEKEVEETDTETATLDGASAIDGNEEPKTPTAMEPAEEKEKAPRYASVVSKQAKGAVLPPRRPKLNRHSSGRKTTSQACRVM